MSEHRLAPALSITAPVAISQNRPVWIAVSLHNPFRMPMLVNGRLIVGGADGQPESHELELAVTGPDGNPLDFAANINPPSPSDEDFVEIAAGEDRSRDIRLDTYFDMKVSGAYSLSVSYANSVGVTRAGVEAFVGEVQALPVRVYIGH
jgi:hypothetical protein